MLVGLLIAEAVKLTVHLAVSPPLSECHQLELWDVAEHKVMPSLAVERDVVWAGVHGA